MTRRSTQTLQCCSAWCQQTVTHRHQCLGHRLQVGKRSESLPPGLHPADDRVLDRNDAGVGLSIFYSANSASECRNGNLLDRMSPYLRDRALCVRAAVALKCDAHQRVRAPATRSIRFRRPCLYGFRFQHDAPL